MLVLITSSFGMSLMSFVREYVTCTGFCRTKRLKVLFPDKHLEMIPDWISTNEVSLMIFVVVFFLRHQAAG